MKIGNKIRKIRELKNISPKDMADRLNMTPQGLNKIEREEVDINIERLLEIAGVFEMKPEDLLTFDERTVFNNIASNHGNQANSQAQVIHNYTSEIERKLHEDKAKLYEENAKLQADKIAIQAKMIEMLEEKVKGLEGK